jgi:DNA-binding FadR family transcriptional regulator
MEEQTEEDIEAAREGLRYLYEIRRKREVAKVAFRNATDEEKAAIIAWARKA